MSAGGWIDAHRSSDGSIDRAALLEILPYGEEFLFVDRVLLLEPRRVEAVYRVPPDSPFVRAHFRDLPIMPGVLTGEGLAQAGTVLVRQHLDDSPDKHLLAMKISDANFVGIARPGDLIEYRVQLDKLGSRMARLSGEAGVGGRLIAKCDFVLTVATRAELRASVV